MERFRSIFWFKGVCILQAVINSHFVFSTTCLKQDSVVQTMEKAKKQNKNYVVAIVTMLPGDKNIFRFSPEKGERSSYVIEKRERKFVVAGEISPPKYVRHFVLKDLLLGVNVEPEKVPRYADFRRDIMKEKTILVEGLLEEKAGVGFVGSSRSSCDLGRIIFKDGKIEGYITLDSTESMMKRQTMTIKEFKKYFQNLDKKLDDKNK